MIFIWGDATTKTTWFRPGVPTHNVYLAVVWGDTTHKPATTMIPKQSDPKQRSESPVALKISRDASFAFVVERAIVFTEIIFELYRGLYKER